MSSGRSKKKSANNEAAAKDTGSFYTSSTRKVESILADKNDVPAQTGAPDRYFLGAQPISPLQGAISVSRDMRQWSELDNAHFANVPLGLKQVLMKVDIPGGVDTTLGAILNVSMLQDQTIVLRPYETYDVAIKETSAHRYASASSSSTAGNSSSSAGERTVTLMRREIISQLLQLTLLHALHLDMLPIWNEMMNLVISGRRNFQDLLEKFSVADVLSGTSWNSFGHKPTSTPEELSKLPWTFVLETVCDDTNVSAVRWRLWAIIRHTDPFNYVNGLQQRGQLYLSQRWSENFHYRRGPKMGHFSGQVSQEDRAAMDRAIQQSQQRDIQANFDNAVDDLARTAALANNQESVVVKDEPDGDYVPPDEVEEEDVLAEGARIDAANQSRKGRGKRGGAATGRGGRGGRGGKAAAAASAAPRVSVVTGELYGRKYGMPKDSIPAERLNNKESLLCSWEQVLLFDISKSACNSGVPHSKVKNLMYRGNFSGDFFRHIRATTNPDKARLLDSIRDKLITKDVISDTDPVTLDMIELLGSEERVELEADQLDDGAERNQAIREEVFAAQLAQFKASLNKYTVGGYNPDQFTKSGSSRGGYLSSQRTSQHHFGISSVGLYNLASKSVHSDYIHCCPTTQQRTNMIEYISPFVLFPCHNLFSNCTGGRVSVDQVDARNYFETRSQAYPIGPNSYKKCVHRCMTNWIEDCNIDLSTWDVQSANISNVSALALCTEYNLVGSDLQTKVETFGANFKGFPKPECCFWISPRFTLPWTVCLLPLPPAPPRPIKRFMRSDSEGKKISEYNMFEDFQNCLESSAPISDAQILYQLKTRSLMDSGHQLFWLIRKAMCLMFPYTKEEATIRSSYLFYMLVFAPTDYLDDAINDIDGKLNASTEGLPKVDFKSETVGNLLLLRCMLRVMATVTIPLLKYWQVGDGHRTLDIHGERTIRAVIRDIKVDLDPLMGSQESWEMNGATLTASGFRIQKNNSFTVPGLFESEPPEVGADHIDQKKWEELYFAVSSVEDNLMNHLRCDFSSSIMPKFVSPMALLKRTFYGAVPSFSPANFLQQKNQIELAQAEWYNNIALELPEDKKAARDARALVAIEARKRQAMLGNPNPDIIAQLDQEIELQRRVLDETLAATEATNVANSTDSEQTAFATQVYSDNADDADDGNGYGAMAGATASTPKVVQARMDISLPHFASTTSHNGWIKLGPLGAQKTEPQERLRSEGLCTEFFGDFNIGFSAMVDNIVSPFEIWLTRVQSMRDRALKLRVQTDNTWRAKLSMLQFAVASLIRDMKALDYLMCIQTCLPMFFVDKILPIAFRDPYNYSNDGSVVLPKAFSCAITSWKTSLGLTSNVSAIPIKKYLGDFHSLETPFARQIALFTQCQSELGIGVAGTGDKITYSSMLYECAMSSNVLSRAKEFLHSIVLLQFGSQAAGKSFASYMMHKLLLKDTIANVSSGSTLSMNQQGAIKDGLLIGYDEGDKDTAENTRKESDTKNAWSNGFLVRVTITDSHEERTIVSSHRCAVAWNANFSQDILSGPIASRSIQLISSSIESAKTQSAENSFAVYAKDAHAVDDKTREMDHSRIGLPWNIVHAIKILLEMFSYSNVLSPDHTIAVETCSLLMEGFKGMSDWGPEMTRYNTILSLAIRSCVTVHAAFRIACDAAVHFGYNHRDGHHAVIPIGFILERARHYLFATTGIAVYELTLLFDGYVNNNQHTHVGQGILATPVVSTVFKAPENIYALQSRCPFLLQPINSSTQRPVINGVDHNPFADEDAATPNVRWSDDPKVFTEPSPIKSIEAEEQGERYAIDFNYLVVSFSSAFRKTDWVNIISQKMPTRYGIDHLFSILFKMEKRTIEVQTNDRNRLYAATYNNMLAGGSGAEQEDDAVDDNDEQDQAAEGDSETRKQNALERMRRELQRRKQKNTRSNKRTRKSLTGDGSASSDTKVNPLLFAASMELAVSLNLPLVRHDPSGSLPIIKVMTPGPPATAKAEPGGKRAPAPKRAKTPYVMAISIKFLEDIWNIMKTAESQQHASPNQSDMNFILETQLSKILPRLPYPACVPMQWFDIDRGSFLNKVIKTGADGKTQTISPPKAYLEKMPSGVATNISATQLASVASTMAERVLCNNPDLTKCVPVRDFLKSLGAMFKRNNIVIDVRDIVKGKYEHSGQTVLRNTANLRDKHEIVATPLTSLLQLTSTARFSFVHSQTIGLQRAVTAAAESQRIKLRVGQDIKGVKYAPDWLAFVKYCMTQRPPLDPCNVMNQMALPMVANAYYAIMTGCPIKITEPIEEVERRVESKRKRPAEPASSESSNESLQNGQPNVTDTQSRRSKRFKVTLTRSSNSHLQIAENQDLFSDNAMDQFELQAGKGAAESASSRLARSLSSVVVEDFPEESMQIGDLENMADRPAAEPAVLSQQVADAVTKADMNLEDSKLPYPMNIHASEIRYHMWVYACKRFPEHLKDVENFRPALFPLLSSETWLSKLCLALKKKCTAASAVEDPMDTA